MTASVAVAAVQAPSAGAAAAATARSSVKVGKVSTAGTASTAGKTSKTTKLSKAARQRIKAHTAVQVAKKQIGDPYRWGASGPGAFDCSGLVVYAWRKAGVKLPRIAASQFRSVRKKVSWKYLKPGDLMFFRGLGHVGMYVGHGKMIHSPHSGTRVRIDKLNGYRKSSFVGAVRPGA
ncbi:peptidoglycan endopeptidase [Sphaerisporangium album]|uniref:Peptidoglycan endopeptidase n=1 Tax=Sphaerisporangium album TaxID=509200 RepID=A0A367FDC9_9ACTN|nr:C40 family peptidase [Sphaerisporangium album]RCG28291.1 peptidoglycan endopeptidase [Sphaerisporangium album]